MKQNTAKRRLEAGETALGVVLGLGSPHVAETIGSTGFDFGVIDAQHGAWNRATIGRAFRALVAGGTVPMVRVPENTAFAIGSMLDRGALGVIVPMVETVADARDAAAAARYPPAGQRSVGGSRLRRWLSIDDDMVNDELFLAVQLETEAGVERAADILGVDGVDGCWVGTADLSLSMGIDRDTESGRSALADAVDRVHAACRETGTVPGIATPGPDDAWLEAGYRFVTIGSDAGFLSDGATAGLEQYEQ